MKNVDIFANTGPNLSSDGLNVPFVPLDLGDTRPNFFPRVVQPYLLRHRPFFLYRQLNPTTGTYCKTTKKNKAKQLIIEEWKKREETSDIIPSSITDYT